MLKTGVLGFITLIICGGLLGHAQGTAFTYQGRLNDRTNPANGFYDFKFSVFAASSGGIALAPPATNSAVLVSNGFFAAILDFGGGVFTGPDRWLEIGVRTNGAVAFTNLLNRQKFTATPYAIAAGTLTGNLPASQLSGTIPGNLLSGGFNNAVVFSNANNFFTGTFVGNGTGTTNVQSTNVVNSAYVINVRDYGAKGDGITDDTLAISNAQVAQISRRLPLYFPGNTKGKFYKISGPLRVYDAITDSRSVDILASDTASRIEIIGDTGATIVQTGDYPVFAFTNGLNWIHFRGLNIVCALGAAVSTKPGIAFYSVGIDGGQNTDNVFAENSEIDGFRFGIYSEAGSIMSLEQISLDNNFYPFCLVNTNSSGFVATRNNSVNFRACDFVGNFQGGIVRGGIGVVFDGCEAGGPNQTNFITLDTSSSSTVILRGGNVELSRGAAVNVIGASPGQSTVRFENFGLADFGSSFLLINTNRTACPQVVIDQGGGIIRDDSSLHTVSVQKGSVMIVESNAFGIWRTNYAGIASSQEIAELGNNYNGPASNPRFEGVLTTKYNYDAKGRTMLSYGAISNWGGVAEKVFNYPLLQYNYDLADGKIPPVGITTNINVIVPGNKTNQLRFTRGVLTDIIPQ